MGWIDIKKTKPPLPDYDTEFSKMYLVSLTLLENDQDVIIGAWFRYDGTWVVDTPFRKENGHLMNWRIYYWQEINVDDIGYHG